MLHLLSASFMALIGGSMWGFWTGAVIFAVTLTTLMPGILIVPGSIIMAAFTGLEE